MNLLERERVMGERTVLGVSNTLWKMIRQRPEFGDLYPGYFTALERVVREVMLSGEEAREGANEVFEDFPGWERILARRVTERFREILTFLEADWEAMETHLGRGLEAPRKNHASRR